MECEVGIVEGIWAALYRGLAGRNNRVFQRGTIRLH